LAGKGSRRKKKGRSVSLEDLYTILEAYSWPITIVLLVLIGAVGIYIRVLPAIHYGLELDANDPWIAYWMAKYFHDNGLFNFEGLKNVKTFWYPEGRNFITSAKVGVSWIAAATYPIGKAFGLTLREWVALMPPIAAAIGIVVVFGFVYRLTGSKLGGLTATALYSLAPGAIVRTTVGFVEKIGIAFPLIVVFLWVILEAYRASETRRKAALALLGGAVGASIALIWGGYALAFAIILVAAALQPFFERPKLDDVKYFYLPLYIGALAVFLALPGHGLSFLTKPFGMLVVSPLVVYLAAYGMARLVGEYDWKLHLWLIVALVSIASTLIASGVAYPGGRIMAALGVRHLSPLVESVQEHAPTAFSTIMREYGPALALTIAGAIIEPFIGGRVSRSGFERALRASIYVVALFLVYANKNLAYMTEMASSMNTLAAGVFAGSLIAASRPQASPSRRRSPRAGEAPDEFRVAMAAVVALIVIIGSAYGLNQAYAMNSGKAASIETSMLGPIRVVENGKPKLEAPINGAWVNALRFINRSTPPDALIVSWWDYGYWITVNTNRPTVADGATLNETQIRMLARVLTGSEDGASALLREVFHAEPGKTYIVFYDVFLGILNNGTLRILPYPSISNITADGTEKAVIHGMGDLPKSFQMLRIGYRVDPFAPSPFVTNYSTIVYQSGVVYHHFPGFTGTPRANVERVYNTLLYRLMVAGLYDLNRGFDKYILDSGCKSIMGRVNITFVLPSVASSGLTVSSLQPVALERFRLVNMSIGCPVQLAHVAGSSGRFVAVIVFIFEWEG